MKKNYHRVILKGLIAIVCVILILGFVYRDSTANKNYEQQLLYSSFDNQRINAFCCDDKQYIFLPGFLNENDIELSNALKKVDNLQIIRSSDIPAVFISTASGNLDRIYENQENKETAKICVYNSDGTCDYAGKLKYIKGRGNYSWDNWDKKPFGLCFSTQTSLLDLGSGYKYALIANASDATLIRNDVARDLEVAVGLKYSHTGRFVDLYINGDYMGDYYLIDSMEVGENRINIHDMETQMEDLLRGTHPGEFPVYETPLVKGWNIPELVSDISGGYLIEREFLGRYTVDYDKNSSCFTTDYEEHFLVKSPEYCSKEQINFICGYINELEGAVRNPMGINTLTGKSYLDYLDITSMAQKYVVEEFTKNYDAGVSSLYFYKDIDSVDSRLCAAPGWDYDMSLGNYLEWMDFSKTGAIGFIHNTDNSDASVWWEDLFEKREFSDITVDIYNRVLKPYVINEEIGRIDALAEMLKDSANMDYIRWKDMYDSLGYFPGDESEYEELKTFMLDRIDFLDGE